MWHFSRQTLINFHKTKEVHVNSNQGGLYYTYETQGCMCLCNSVIRNSSLLIQHNYAKQWRCQVIRECVVYKLSYYIMYVIFITVNVVIKYVQYISELCLFIEHINMCIVINGAGHECFFLILPTFLEL